MSCEATSAKSQPTGKHRRLKEIVALLLFLIVGFVVSSPCLCYEGEISGRYKTVLFLLVLCRLAWNIWKQTFRFADYFLYLAIVIAFCVWADSRY